MANVGTAVELALGIVFSEQPVERVLASDKVLADLQRLDGEIADSEIDLDALQTRALALIRGTGDAGDLAKTIDQITTLEGTLGMLKRGRAMVAQTYAQTLTDEITAEVTALGAEYAKVLAEKTALERDRMVIPAWDGRPAQSLGQIHDLAAQERDAIERRVMQERQIYGVSMSNRAISAREYADITSILDRNDQALIEARKVEARAKAEYVEVADLLWQLEKRLAELRVAMFEASRQLVEAGLPVPDIRAAGVQMRWLASAEVVDAA